MVDLLRNIRLWIVAIMLAVVLPLPVAVCAQEPEPESENRAENPKQRFLFMFRRSSERCSGNVVEADSSRRRSRRNRNVGVVEAMGAESDAAVTDSVGYDGAHLRFDETVWDFGEVSRKGGDAVKEFRFENDGSKPLVITGITMSCTCIKVEYPKRPVGVGERSSIRLIYEPHKMSPGVFYKVVQVHSNSVDGVRLLTVRGSAFDGRKKR